MKALALRPEEAREVMTTQPYVNAGLNKGGQIFYLGRWRDVCRTDLKDDTRTSFLSHPDPRFGTREFWLNRPILGARVTDEAFFIIDSLSDG